MQPDFLDAHKRHWNDAEYLFGNQRWANADHLYGISAECGLKQLMFAFGMTVDTQGNPANRNDWGHADKVWQRFESYRSGHQDGAKYALPNVNPFNNWNASQRYANQSYFDEVRTKNHQASANQVCALIKRAKIDGLV